MKLVWTEKAQRRIGEVLEYIEREFGAKARQIFIEKTQDFTRILIEFPEMGTLEIKEKNVRGFQLTNQTRVFYRVKKNCIIILTLIDSRQNPQKRPK
jgi:plasmid stabilization system protein ParE